MGSHTTELIAGHSARAPVSVIVPTRNRHASVAELAESLISCTMVGEVIVVDDASNPPVELKDSDVHVIRLERRRWVSAARNLGASKARGEILFFVDDDCVVSPDAVRLLTNAFERTNGLGIAGPVIAFRKRPQVIWCAGTHHTRWLGLTKLRGCGSDIETAKLLPRRCDGFPTAFAITRLCFDAVGGFDERAFPMHMEEADLAARVRAAGYAVELVPEAIVWHDFGPDDSLSRQLHITDASRAYLVGQARGRFLRRHRPSRWAHAARMLFWLSALTPIYLAAILGEKGRSWRQRLRLAESFLRGVGHGSWR